MRDLSTILSDDYLNGELNIEELHLPSNSIDEEEIKSAKKMRRVKILFGILCVALFCELIVYKYVMPSFSMPKLTVKGHELYSAEELGKLLVPMEFANFFDFDADRAAALLLSEAGIEDVAITKKFPDTIAIEIKERTPVALTFVVENGCTSPVEIDRNGVLFQSNSNRKKEQILPIVSGLPVEYMTSGMRIPSKYRPLIEQINKINELGQNYFASISEICVLPKEYGNYELALIPSQSKVRVLTDRSLNEEALKYMMVVLDVVNQIGSEVSEVDLRYGSVSYRTRN